MGNGRSAAVAKQQLCIVLDNDNNYCEAHFQLARLLADVFDDTTGAISHLESVLRINPKHKQATEILNKLRFHKVVLV